MIRQRLKRLFLPAAFVAACALALWTVVGRRGGAKAASGTRDDPLPAVRWRAQMAARANAPCAFSGGWVVSDAAGGVTAFSAEGKKMWQAAFSNQVFDAGAAVAEGLAVVASRQGQVFALRADTGERVWTRETEGQFQHAPLTGKIEGEPVLWLVSQPDGQLVCLRVSDGRVLWRGEATNRCDGAPVAWQGRVAYGNCDGAVYVFDGANGRMQGSVAVGAEDQMAGGMLATDNGRLVAGTRQGHLAAVNVATLTLEARVSVSQSEAFVTPVEAFGNLIATGTREGEIVFCRLGGQGLQEAGRVAVGVAVDGLAFSGGRLYALAGGSLCVLAAAEGPAARLALGDEVYGLSAGPGGALACVADQAVVGIKGGGL